MNEVELTGRELNEILIKQIGLLSQILDLQHKLHDSVSERNWTQLESNGYKMDRLSTDFAACEKQRVHIVESLGFKEDDFYALAENFSPVLKDEILENFCVMRQKLTVSLIENNALRDYIKISQNFMKGVLSELDAKHCKTYSASGEIVDKGHSAIVLNAVG